MQSLFSKFFIYSKNQFKISLDKSISRNKNVLSKSRFHTTPNSKAIPPLLWLLIKPVTKIGAIFVGRGFRKWWKALPGLRREVMFNHFRKTKFRYMTGLGLTGAGAYYNYQNHVQLTPITHRKRFILFSQEQLIEIEKIEREQMLETFETKILDFKSPYTNRALRVANRLFVANQEIPEVSAIKWKLTVIEDDVINACAFPSGEVFVFTGLLDFVENDDELAIIMAHEMSHAVLQHAAEQASHSRIIDILSIGFSLFCWAMLPSDYTAFFSESVAEKVLSFAFELPYSRSIEKEADEVGMILAAKACFDVRYNPVFWRRMQEYTGEETVPEILSTHPSNETRALELESLIPAALLLRNECKCYDLPEKLPPQKPVVKKKKAEAKKTKNEIEDKTKK